MSSPQAARVRTRFLILRGLRWFPIGMVIPVLILLLTGRGFSLTTIGVAVAAQGVVVMGLELPTGGLADAIGRRPVLIGATVLDAVAVLILAVWAHSLPILIAYFALQGVYRALESGPLDAWYVDAAQAADPDADIVAGLGAGGAVLGAAIAAGSLVSAAIVAFEPFGGIDPLVGPLVVYLVIRGIEVVALARLMTEDHRHQRPTTDITGARQVLAVVGEAVRLVRQSRALLALVSVEFFWGFGMATWENLMPVHLETAVGSTERAAALLGPVTAAAWAASAVAAALVPAVARGIGVVRCAVGMRLAQGVTVAGMGLAAGPIGIIAGFLATYAIHGAANPIHMGLLHSEVDSRHRTTVLSVNSMVGMPAFAIGGIALGAISDLATIPTAMVVGAVVLALAAPLYWVAGSARAGPEPRALAATQPVS